MSYLFGARLQELRAQARLTLRELADALGTDHTYLSHIESGRRAPPEELLLRLSDYFGEDPDILRLQAGQVPERILAIMQRQPQTSLSLIASLEKEDTETDWFMSPESILGDRRGSEQIDALDNYDRSPFARSVHAGKNTAIYNAHSYHTKVPHQGIIPFIEHYTEPGDLVLDPFCGSGMTGVAAMLSGRDALLVDLSPAAVHIARNYTTPCDPQLLEETWAQVSDQLSQMSSELYGTKCERCGGPGLIEYTVFTDVFECPDCVDDLSLWACGRDEEGKLTGEVRCSRCDRGFSKNDLRWLRSEPCWVNVSCSSCKGREERTPSPNDLEHLDRLAAIDAPGWSPDVSFGPEWEMWRQGHADRGITSVRDFFTPRNLHALSALRERLGSVGNDRASGALLFAFTGCINRASKRYQWNHKRPTNVLSGTLYVSSLFYEFNVFNLFERKLRAALRLFGSTFSAGGRVAATVGSATSLDHIPDASVDYVFTDPPFGSNIYYSDSSLLWEAWLSDLTDRKQEMVVRKSPNGQATGKSLAEYQEMLTDALREVRRVLKPNRWATVVFHNSSSAVWEAVKHACAHAGFTLGSAVMFDKKQKSFKAIKGMQEGERVANYDIVLNLQRRTPLAADASSAAASEARIIEKTREHLMALENATADERSTPYLHSLAVQQAWSENLDFETTDLPHFEALLDREFESRGGQWFLRDGELQLAGSETDATARRSS
jgi:transcriptional regulator with XRE-family HTH domain/16S rRNA G966 N2-methylase RsmD